MKIITITLFTVLLFVTPSFAGNSLFGPDDSSLSYGSSSGGRPYKDSWGNSYKRSENLYKDSDGDGVSNYNDYNDRNPNIQNPYQSDYGTSKKYQGIRFQ